MKTFLQNLFAPTTGSLTASLTKVVDRLEAHAERKSAAAQAHYDAMVAAENEANAADRVARKLGGLFL